MTGPEIIVIAADPMIRQMAESTMQDLGAVSTFAGSGQALARLGYDHAFKVLLVEVGLDGTDHGWFAQMRSNPAETVLILLSTAAHLPLAADLTRHDVAEIVPLPVTADQLHDAVLRVLQRRRATRELMRLRAIVPLYEMSRMFMLQTDLDELLHRVLETAVTETGAQRGSLMLIDENRKVLTIQAAVNIPDDVIRRTQVRLGEGIAGWVAKTGEPLVVNGPDDLPEFLRVNMLGGTLRSSMCLPLTVKSQVIGVINLTKTTLKDPFAMGDAELLSVLVGQAAVAIVNARLIKQMEAAYEELSRLDHLKTEFINVSAHELRTPVSIMVGYASLLVDMVPGELREMVEPMVIQSQQLQRVVDDLFQLDYLQSLKRLDPDLNVQPVNLSEVARVAVREAASVAEARALDLTLRTTTAVYALADETSLRRILRHLIDNALKFTPAGGAVVLSVAPEGGEAHLRVQDTGPGVPAEERERIFAPFYQVSPSLRRSHGGMGLGLSLARRLAQVQGGRLWLEPNTAVGASFCLALPLVEFS